jgi:hypothetical protein
MNLHILLLHLTSEYFFSILFFPHWGWSLPSIEY